VSVRRAARTPLPEAIADGAALMFFTVLGARFHSLPLEPDVVLRTTLPLWAAWFVTAVLLGTYARRRWWVFLLNWAVAVPAGLLIRQLTLGRELDFATAVFVGVSMAATLPLLLAGRGLLAALRGTKALLRRK
jgi:hypothetical protein